MRALVYHGPGEKAWEGHLVAPGQFITHHFELDQFIDAYDVFGRAAETGALKVVLSRAA